jgi:putative membrane protein
MAQKRPLVQSILLHYVHGLLMGTADIIPGVSGGTMALIVGIYERLIDSIKAGLTVPVSLVRGRMDLVRQHWNEVHWRLVLPLGAGIVTALVIAARFIPHFLETYPVESRALFFGLIAASILIPWQRMTVRGWHAAAVIVVSAVIAFVLVGLPGREVADPSMIQVFVAASIAICAMILPGVSGAFLLLAMGMYVATLEALHNREMLYVGVFILGALFGLGVFSRVLSWLLHRYHDLTMAALIGLMAGSLRALWPWQLEDRTLLAPQADPSLALAIGLAVLGFAIVFALSRLSARRIESADVVPE